MALKGRLDGGEDDSEGRGRQTEVSDDAVEGLCGHPCKRRPSRALYRRDAVRAAATRGGAHPGVAARRGVGGLPAERRRTRRRRAALLPRRGGRRARTRGLLRSARRGTPEGNGLSGATP